MKRHQRRSGGRIVAANVVHNGNFNNSRSAAMIREGTCGMDALMGGWDRTFVPQKECQTYLKHLQHDSGVIWKAWGQMERVRPVPFE